MAKEWILNAANMRFQLTRKRQVGAVAALIRECAPKTAEEWADFYLARYSKAHLENLGRRLFIKVTDVCRAEIDNISEQDCIDFIYDLVIHRTFDGYQSEIKTIYGQLEKALGITVRPAPDKWDRGYNVDYFIEINGKFIGLQVKPAVFEYIPQIINERAQQAQTHKKFTARHGGKVFYVISLTEGKRKVIHNPEVIEEIRAEIKRLRRS